MAHEIAIRACALPFGQHTERLSYITCENRILCTPLHALEALKPLGLFNVRYIICKISRRRTRPLGIFEDIQTVVRALLNQLQGLYKVTFGLARKADDDVAC